MQPGVILQGRWRIERALGSGASGGVYLATDLQLRRQVAIKAALLPGDPRTQAAWKTQLEREARLLATLDHVNIVRVFDYIDTISTQYLVMDFLDGRTMESVYRDPREPMSSTRILYWTEQILDALEYLHTHAPVVVFRDLKPANIMIGAGDHVSLIDFGIARACETGVATATSLKSVGTPGYAPVEQYYGVTQDVRSDIYALGATLYELFTRTVPPPSVAVMSGDQRLVAPRLLCPDIPAAVEDAIVAMLAIRKEDRPQSIGEVRLLLSGQASGSGALEPFDPLAVPQPTLPQPVVDSTSRDLPFSHPFSVVYRGPVDAARKVHEHALRVGIAAQLLYHHDPMVPQAPGWMVIIPHALSRT